jgi:hypothetical protein
MRNGNVPVALQRWEYLGRDDAVLKPRMRMVMIT